MKILVSKNDSHYLVDLAKLKPMSTVDLVREAGADELATLDVSALRTTTMDELLALALKPSVPATAARSKTSTAKGSGLSAGELAAIREWAKANGHKVADKGRIAQEIITAYNAAH